MIGYTTLGSDDLVRSRAFYDPVLAVLGAKLIDAFSDDSHAFYGSGGQSLLCLIRPFDGRPASAGNGTMVALSAAGRQQVHDTHAKAIQLGAINEGDPGLRGSGPFYGAYFRDPDGNKLCVFTMKGE
jgi:catechol 2,3-dioxygenase-like lactoylglutathione lyase family enzyme